MSGLSVELTRGLPVSVQLYLIVEGCTAVSTDELSRGIVHNLNVSFESHGIWVEWLVSMGRGLVYNTGREVSISGYILDSWYTALHRD